MKTLLVLTVKSIWNRRLTIGLTLFTIMLSVTLLLGVERIRNGARSNFANTISGTDLIVGARSGPVQLLLYSVFRIGNPTNNISWDSYEKFAGHKSVKWTIPISMGDSHRGFRVLGTDSNYFEHYRYGPKNKLTFAKGRPFSDVFEVVLGQEVAHKLKYSLGDSVVLSHGLGKVSFQNHGDKPFVVTGILEKTGTPVDRSLHVHLEGIEAIHMDWEDGAPPMPGEEIHAHEVHDHEHAHKLESEQISVFLVGLKSRITTLQLQRKINDYKGEPLLAILPGLTLLELWNLIGVVEAALLVVSGFVVLVGLMGMLTAILTSLNERRREMAILRSVGARPHTIFGLLVLESTLLSLVGSLGGLVVLYLAMFLRQGWISDSFGLYIPLKMPGLYDLLILGSVSLCGLVLGCVPAWMAYKKSLADGLTIHT